VHTADRMCLASWCGVQMTRYSFRCVLWLIITALWKQKVNTAKWTAFLFWTRSQCLFRVDWINRAASDNTAIVVVGRANPCKLLESRLEMHEHAQNKQNTRSFSLNHIYDHSVLFCCCCYNIVVAVNFIIHIQYIISIYYTLKFWIRSSERFVKLSRA
jgi:hypothetical protein